MYRIKRVNETFLVTVAAAVVGSFIVGIIAGMVGGDELIMLLISQLTFFAPTAFYLWENKFNLKETIRLKPVKVSTVCMLVGFMYSIMPAATFVNAVSLKFTTNTIDTTITGIAEKYPLIIGVLVVAVMPSILEESVYRGVFFNEYRKLHPGKAVVLSGLLFGLAHMNFNQFVYAFLLGMVFAVVVEVTDSIVSSMVLHFVMNGTSMISVYAQVMAEEAGMTVLETEQNTQEVIDTYIQNGWIPAIAGLVIGYLILKIIAQNEGREGSLKTLFIKEKQGDYREVLENGQTGGGKMATLALWMGMVICLGIMLLVEVTA